MGGCQGLLRGIASGLADKGHLAVTFDMRGVGRSIGRASITGFPEVKDVVAVCKWVCENLGVGRILLVGSSAASWSHLEVPQAIAFHNGNRDGFTSFKQLQAKLSSAAGPVETHLIEGASHFQMEGPAFDAQMVQLIIGFVGKIPDDLEECQVSGMLVPKTLSRLDVSPFVAAKSALIPFHLLLTDGFWHIPGKGAR
ncbi:hypothetical protein AKJ16_DCAP10271 [Drosera capensis]